MLPDHRSLRPLATAALATALGAMLTLPASAALLETDDARTNVIVLIADGMGYNHIDVANLFTDGQATYQDQEVNPHLATHGSDSVPVQDYQSFDVQLAVETGYIYSQPYAGIGAWDTPRHATRDNPNERLNVTDSAAAATAMSTGVRTKGGFLGLDDDEEPLLDMVDVASTEGLATGIATTARFWSDTPAGFAVHTDDDDTDGIIAQLLGHEDLDVIMGGGHPEFTNDGEPKPGYFRYLHQDVWEGLNGGPAVEGLPDWTLVDDRASFQGLATGETPQRVFGLAPTDGALFHDRPGDREIPFAEPRSEEIPRLPEMALGTLNVLANASADGFFALIEQATVDSAGHAGELGRTIENMVAFHETVDAVIEWVETESSWAETTVIVTADHETGNLQGAGTLDSGGFEPITGSAGELPAAEFTDFTDGEPGEQNPHYHTHQLVPLFAQGPAADALAAAATNTDPVRGAYLQNTDIAHVLHAELRSANDAPEPEPEPTQDPEPEPTDAPSPDPAPAPGPEPEPTGPGEAPGMDPTAGGEPQPDETDAPEPSDGAPEPADEPATGTAASDSGALAQTGVSAAGLLATVAAAFLLTGGLTLGIRRSRAHAGPPTEG
ncbi:alkaline phosphatase [Ruania zhangjianzhongii]|uniref:alkaline phosphatase n=1 Tax=Ruania zhangjianzhongii TaxID=2603206 RepID=UPI00143CCFA9|nr:alkaline phosphatase [Ruania zhangjianzhongii]